MDKTSTRGYSWHVLGCDVLNHFNLPPVTSDSNVVKCFLQISNGPSNRRFVIGLEEGGSLWIQINVDTKVLPKFYDSERHPKLERLVPLTGAWIRSITASGGIVGNQLESVFKHHLNYYFSVFLGHV